MSAGELTAGVLLTSGERIRESLRQDIISGKLRPGERLLLGNLAQKFKVSKIPVRDALRELEKDQLVEGRATVGYRVCTCDANKVIRLYTVREALECQVARLCAATVKPFQIQELEELAREADMAMGPAGLGYVEIQEDRERRFHVRLGEIADCPELLQMLNRVLTLLGTFSWARGEILGLSHVALVHEIAGGDSDAAERAMREHIALTELDIEKLRELQPESASS